MSRGSDIYKRREKDIIFDNDGNRYIKIQDFLDFPEESEEYDEYLNCDYVTEFQEPLTIDEFLDRFSKNLYVTITTDWEFGELCEDLIVCDENFNFIAKYHGVMYESYLAKVERLMRLY